MRNIICECTGNFIEGNEKWPTLSFVHKKMTQTHHAVITEHLNIPVIPSSALASLLGWHIFFSRQLDGLILPLT